LFTYNRDSNVSQAIAYTDPLEVNDGHDY